MSLDQYEVEFSEYHTDYEFVSVGKRGSILKVVQYTKMSYSNWYNLGFGDKNLETGKWGDLTVSDNGDDEKVLATVGATAIDFLDWHPQATIFATGSTPVRTRKYQMGLNRIHGALTEGYDVQGFVGGQWQPFERNTNYEAFLMSKK